MTKIITRKGKKIGPTTIVMGGVHGNEKTGLGVVSGFIKSGWSPDVGEVIFIIANEQALADNVRYLDRDLNRCFGNGNIGLGSEQNIASELETYIQEADYLLDIHNTTNPKSEAFLICEHDELSCYIDVQKSISGLDIIHPGGSDGYGNTVGCKSICIEAGSIYDDLTRSIERCEDQILNFLMGVGNIADEPVIYAPEIYNFSVQYVTKTDFTPLVGISDFQEFEKGAYIGKDGDEDVFSPFDGVCLFAYTKNSSGEEGFVYGKKLD